MDVTDSDHKPVRCKFSAEIAHVDRSVRRQEFGNIVKSNENIRTMLAEMRRVPETVVSTDSILLKNQDTYVLRITNRCVDDKAVFRFICGGQSAMKEDAHSSDQRPRGSFGFPRWLEVLFPCIGRMKGPTIRYQYREASSNQSYCSSLLSEGLAI